MKRLKCRSLKCRKTRKIHRQIVIVMFTSSPDNQQFPIQESRLENVSLENSPCNLLSHECFFYFRSAGAPKSVAQKKTSKSSRAILVGIYFLLAQSQSVFFCKCHQVLN